MKLQIPGISAYPCQWPESWPRTRADERASRPQIKVTFARARDGVLDSLRLMGATEAVISSDIRTKPNGLPYADARLDRSGDPSVAVYWIDAHGRPLVIACDRWASTRENLRSIGFALEGLRAIERSGVSEILERAYQGFAALPANAGAHQSRDWRDVLGLELDKRTTISPAVIEGAYKVLSLQRHPDRGGSHEAMIELNAAREQALREISSR